MALGPLEYAVIGFEGSHFTGEIWPEIRAIQDRGVVRLVDLVFVEKDANGKLSIVEVSNLSNEAARAYEAVMANIQGIMTAEDVAEAATCVPPASSAAVILFEHTWAIGLQKAVRRANGRLLSAGMVRPDTLETVEKELASTGAS